MESIASRVAAGKIRSVEGRWQRHVPAQFAGVALDGFQAYGRWGTKQGFPVLYFGRPIESVVVEAYRHLVDPVDNPALAAEIRPRKLVTCDLRITRVLDLTSAQTRLQLDLTMDELQSDTSDRTAYEKCQQVSEVAHQLRLHGILAPAATRCGETLALFPECLPLSERPSRVVDDIDWLELPPDPRQPAQPRRLRVVRGLGD